MLTGKKPENTAAWRKKMTDEHEFATAIYWAMQDAHEPQKKKLTGGPT